ncbi:MAG: class I SAM-dependent RNA methyltransferase [Clostridia bacterium]|nr:class I SAM-dependent RNA methyltransferase [Clostridia bacterium]
MKICVNSASGVEAVTKREIYKLLGIENLAAINGRIVFDGEIEEVALCNLYLRTANRVEIVVGEFAADNFDSLFDGIKDIEWEKYIPSDGKIIVNAKSQLSKIFAISATQSIVKKAICERLIGVYGGQLPETGARYKIEAAINKDFVTVTLDSSGEGLHRRGYRGLVGEAPLKETLASALIQLSVYNPDKRLVDLFCGSGTIPIEACLIAKNIPSGLYRDFDFAKWSAKNRELLLKLKEKAESEIKWEKEISISGFDIDEKQIRLARRHAKEAGVGDFIHFQRADVADFSSHYPYGIIISNPPYGERLSDRKEVEKLYKTYGQVYSSLKDWSAYTLTSVTDFEKLFGKKADKKRKLYNGKLECFYYSVMGAKPPKNE